MLFLGPGLTKLVRYSAASIVAVAAGQIVLVTLIEAGGVIAWVANIAATAVGAIPNYVINRRWTWGVRGPNSWRNEVLPFWLLALAGLVVSTAFVALASFVWGTTLAASIASIAGFGTVWMGRFLFLDRIVWGEHHAPTPDGLGEPGVRARWQRT